MTHVVHPYSQRLGIIRDWKSRWFAPRGKYQEYLKGDVLLRNFLTEKLRGNYLASVEMERSEKILRIIIKTSRPGMIIGRQGEGSNKLREDVLKFMKKHNLEAHEEVKIDIEDIKSPESNATIVAQMIAEQLEKRMPFRRIMKQTVEKVMANRDVSGVKIELAGRLNGADMARREKMKMGRIPLQTFRADVDYAHEEARLPYDTLGVKVWIYKGEVFDK
ncbi:MAG: 30S ribosomal protein S3 [Candidatus Pacebacteria bacterium]|nr:30S ribosomal protein S3 [Candidatus Paceibacterota bacterium]